MPRRLRTAPQCSMPFERGSRIASLNFIHSPLGRRKSVAFPLAASVIRGKSKGVRVVFPPGNLHPQVCPLDFFPAPRDGRDDGDGAIATAPTIVKIDTTVTSSRFYHIKCEPNISSGMVAVIFIADTVFGLQPSGVYI